jgi:hypothetical protein
MDRIERARAAAITTTTLQTDLEGYLARARELPESGPKLPADATASVAAMIDVLAARGATQRTAAN